METAILGKSGETVLAMGNEALARGALEAGVGYFSMYPGTPATEIGLCMQEAAASLPRLYTEISANEHVALQGAQGASMVGVRAMVAMKHVGMNAASDPLHFLGLTGVNAGLVIALGSDPGSTCSTSDQDDHWSSLHTHVPILEPSDIQEAKDYTRAAFELSERFSVCVLVNSAARLCHNIGALELGDMPQGPPPEPKFVPNPVRYLNLFDTAVVNHQLLLDRMAELTRYAADSPLNTVLEGGAEWGVVTSGVNYHYVLEALDILGLDDVPVLKLGMSYPLSGALLSEFARPLKRLVVVEDGEGFIEFQAKKAAFEEKLAVGIEGKEYLPRVGELSVDLVTEGLSLATGREAPAYFKETKAKADRLVEQIPARVGTFCPGCPHRGISYALNLATGREMVCGTDIGCYTLTLTPPFHVGDWATCMNAGLAVAQGMSQLMPEERLVSLVGDSTLFHSGLPALINAVHNRANVLHIILDNFWTAMTGHQPSFSTRRDVDGNELKPARLRELLKTLGVEYVRTVNPLNVRQMTLAIHEALKQEGLKVIIAEAECALQKDRRERRLDYAQDRVFYEIEPERCQLCDECYRELCCPAILQEGRGDERRYYIDEATCNRCGMCYEVCLNGAIRRVEIDLHLPQRRVG